MKKLYENNIIHNAGYEIIDFECYKHTNEHKYYVVLGVARTDLGTKFVTWESTDLKTFYWGHYINEYVIAKKDYHERLIHLYEFSPF